MIDGRLDKMSEQITALELATTRALKSKTASGETPSKPQSDTTDRLSVENIALSSPVRASPSRNPVHDITGASARPLRRYARQSDCRSACRAFVDCIAKGAVCATLPTDGARHAAHECVKICESKPSVRARLLQTTGCPENAAQPLPTELKFICPKSP